MYPTAPSLGGFTWDDTGSATATIPQTSSLHELCSGNADFCDQKVAPYIGGTLMFVTNHVNRLQPM